MRYLICCAVLSLLVGCPQERHEAPPVPPPPPAPAPEPIAAAPAPPSVSPAVLERGRYLVEAVAVCATCHTPIGPQGPIADKRFGGGFEMPDVFGTWRGPNISQDRETGIGAWTDAQIIDAIRLGKRPNGEQMFPIMPYLHFNKLSDDDAKAIVAYLRTIAPVKNVVVRATDLKLAKIAAPPPAGTPPAADPISQGHYLVTLMQCTDCHTQLTKEGAPDMTKEFAGGFPFEMPMLGTGTLYSSNITPDNKTGIGKYTDIEVINAFTKGRKRDGSPIMPPMAMQIVGWAQLTEADAKAAVAYLRTLKPIVNKVPKSTFKPGAPPPADSPH